MSMSSNQPPGGGSEDYTGLAVAVGRIEEGIKGLNSKIDGVVTTSTTHGETLSRHEVAIRLLESKQVKRTPWYFVVTVVFGILSAVAVAVGTIVALIQLASK